MEHGPYTLQVFTSLILILGAAFVALICDFLKSNNEQLRELTIELKVRREEEHKRVELMMPYMLANPYGRAALGLVDEASDEETDAHEDGAADREPMAAEAETETAPETQIETVVSSAPILDESEMHQTGQAKPQLVDAPSNTAIEQQRIPEQVLVDAMAASTATRPGAAPAPSKLVTFKKDWNSLLASKRAKAPAATQSPLLTAVMEATATDLAKTGGPALPSGFQDGFVVAELIANKQLVNGLVMSIGISAPQISAGTLREPVHHLIQSLLGPNDFATQCGPNEFLIIFPGERGAAAQRRLSRVAQQLWEFQLHSLGTDAAMFSWGGLEIRNEPISEAIASAKERMQENRRGRKRQAAESPAEFETLRQAV
jgi:hypothetical protein